jgi:hypothetical protein
VARILAGLAVLAVAVVAGIVSFTHIEALALAHGYALGTARLLPVSVDGLIVAASLACLTEARVRGEASRLSRSGLVLGILATLAANVAAGAQFGIVGAMVNAWPAIAFIVASEILLRMLRAAPDLPSAGETAETVAAAAPPAHVAVPETVAGTVSEETTGSGPSVPGSSPVSVPEDMPPAVPRVAPVAPVGAHGRARRHPPKQPIPEHVFAAEIEAGELPSLRQVKERMHVGTDRARVIRDQLSQDLPRPQSLPEEAHAAA